MPAVKLTDRDLRGVKPCDTPVEFRDTEQRGLIFRMQPSGVASFYLQYRNEAGETRRVKIGRFGEIGVPAARAKAKKLLGAIALGADPAGEKRRKKRQALTLRQFIEEKYQPWAVANLKSHHSVMKRLRYAFEPLLDKPLTELTPRDFDENRIRRARGKDGRVPKAATLNRDQMTLRAALTKARHWELITENPLDKVKRAREDRNTQIRAITAEEEKAILAALAERREKRPPDWYFDTLFIVALDTGIRRGEALALMWSSVDLEAGTLTVVGAMAKSGNTRVVPLTARAVTALRDWRDRCPEGDRVFVRATVDNVRWLWADICTKAGVAGLRWHDLRHSYASRLAHAGAGVLMIKNLLGHSSIATSQRYMHAVESDLRRAVDLLEAANVKTA